MYLRVAVGKPVSLEQLAAAERLPCLLFLEDNRGRRIGDVGDSTAVNQIKIGDQLIQNIRLTITGGSRQIWWVLSPVGVRIHDASQRDFPGRVQFFYGRVNYGLVSRWRGASCD